ncbi:MAG: cytochrome c3 family protein [Bacillota bacterium]
MADMAPAKEVPPVHQGGHPFFPDHFFKELLVMMIAAIVLIIIAAIRPASGFIGLPDPATAPQVSFQPQWYLFYLYLGSNRVSTGLTMTIACLILAMLFAVPFIDQSPRRKPIQRPVALGLFIVAIVAAIYMAGSGVKTTLAAGSVNIDGMKGVHCSSCHSYLKGVKTFEPIREGCLKCHADEGRAKGTFSANAPMNFTCQSCHKPHIGKQPVSCLTCHADQTKVALHAQPAHQTCQTCHQPHSWKVAADASVRDTCLTCHGERKEHMTGLPCTACHKFSAK